MSRLVLSFRAAARFTRRRFGGLARLWRESGYSLTRRLPSALACIIFLLACGASWAAPPDAAALAHFRTAWGRFQLSVCLPYLAVSKPSDIVAMREDAIREMRSAALLAPREPRYLESLGYLYAEDRRPDKAATWYRRAAAAAPREPRIPYLLARLYAAGARPEARDAAAARARAAQAYDRALALDPRNGVLLLEAAALYHRAGLDTEARSRLERALYHTPYRLYTLPAPHDLLVEEGNPPAAWFALQERFWAEPLSAAYALAQWCVSLGRDADARDRLNVAQSHYTHAVTIGRHLTAAQPQTLASALVGLKCQEMALEPLVAFAARRGEISGYQAQLERVRAASQAALGELAAADSRSAPSVEQLLEDQARAVERILAAREAAP